MNVEIASVPRFTIVLQVLEPTHHGSKTWLAPSESLYLIFNWLTKVEIWEERYSVIPQFVATCGGSRFLAIQPFNVHF